MFWFVLVGKPHVAQLLKLEILFTWMDHDLLLLSIFHQYRVGQWKVDIKEIEIHLSSLLCGHQSLCIFIDEVGFYNYWYIFGWEKGTGWLTNGPLYHYIFFFLTEEVDAIFLQLQKITILSLSCILCNLGSNVRSRILQLF